MVGGFAVSYGSIALTPRIAAKSARAFGATSVNILPYTLIVVWIDSWPMRDWSSGMDAPDMASHTTDVCRSQ